MEFMTEADKMDISVPATISKVTTMADKSLRLQVDTQEIDGETKAKIFSMHDMLGWFVFAPAPIKELTLDDLPQIHLEDNEKTPSQRLRSIMFVYWKEKRLKQDFDIFYRYHINQMINKFRDGLDKPEED